MVSGTRDNPPHELPWLTFHCVVENVKQLFESMTPSCLGGRDNSGGRELSHHGRVTLASGTTFLHINALARLTGTTLGLAGAT